MAWRHAWSCTRTAGTCRRRGTAPGSTRAWLRTGPSARSAAGSAAANRATTRSVQTPRGAWPAARTRRPCRATPGTALLGLLRGPHEDPLVVVRGAVVDHDRRRGALALHAEQRATLPRARRSLRLAALRLLALRLLRLSLRLLLAGIRQILQPRYTAETILGIKGDDALLLVRELGFGNLAIGVVGTLSLFFAGWVVPAALVGGLFYGLAGINHALQRHRNAKENLAMVSDLFAAVVLLVFCGWSTLH